MNKTECLISMVKIDRYKIDCTLDNGIETSEENESYLKSFVIQLKKTI